MPGAIQAQVADLLKVPEIPAERIAAFADAGVVQAPGPLSLPSPKPRKGARVARTRNSGTWTEAQFWGAVRGVLRRIHRSWKPAQAALRAARVRYPGKHNAKWAYLCADCKRLFRRRGVQIDHQEPCGELTDLAHLAEWVGRLLPEDPKAYRVRCLKCHQKKTDGERQARKVSRADRRQPGPP